MSYEKSRKVKERLARLRNYQSRDFWAMVFARPLTILLLLPVADVDQVTSNRITAASVLTKVVGIAVLIACPSYWGGFWAGALVNLGLVLDNMDGTLARYRGSSTFMGYYADKVSDIVTEAGMFFAIAWRQYMLGHDTIDLVLPLIGFFGVSISGYAKWVANRLVTDIELHQAIQAGSVDAFARKRLDQNPSTPPPGRTAMQWLAWFVDAVKSLWKFNEVDIYFFLWLALVIDWMPLFTRVMSALYALGILVGPIAMAMELRKRLKQAGLE